MRRPVFYFYKQACNEEIWSFLYNAPIMSYITRSSRRRHPITFFLLLAMAVQSLVPFGYMPKAFADGGFIELCPQGVSDEVMAILHADHDVGHSSHSDHSNHNDHSNHSGHGDHAGHASHNDHAGMDHKSHQPAPEDHSAMHEGHHVDHHSGHHADHSASIHSAAMPDMHAAGLEQVESNDAHSASWQNSCPYGAVTAAVELALDASPIVDIQYEAGYQPTSLIAREFTARLQRKQRSRAPPIQHLS